MSDPASYSNPELSLSAVRRIDQACLRFETALKTGQQPFLEDYLAGLEGAERAALFRWLLRLELDYRRRAGESPRVEDYTARFPDLEKNIQAAFQPPTNQPGQTQDHVESAPPVGTRVRYFGDYELLEEIAPGVGGMGIVYRARQMTLKRMVALKMVLAGRLASPEQLQRFRLEAEAAAHLEHEGIVQVYEVGEHEGLPYFTMRLLEGGNLAQRMAGVRQDLRRAVELVAQVARAVHHAHQRGVLHRDLKPANILLDSEGRPFVTDFGLAKLLENFGPTVATGGVRSQSGTLLGTPAYMAPEQARRDRQVTTAADMYALGAILYEVLTGHPPFRAENLPELLRLVQEKEPERPRMVNRKIDRDLETIALKCLEKETGQRYGSANEVTEELSRWLREEPIEARAVGRLERGWRWCRRNPVVGSLLGLVGVLLLLGSGIAWGLAAWALREKGRADTQTGIAEAKAEEAGQQTVQAMQQLAVTELHRYNIEIALAHREWEAGKAGRAMDLLNGCQWNLRSWEYRYLYNMFNSKSEKAIYFNNTPIVALSYNREGTQLATASDRGALAWWDMETGKRVQAFWLPDNDWGSRIGFSLDGDLVAIASKHTQDKSTGNVHVCNARTGKTIHTLKGHKGQVTEVTFSREGTWLATAGEDKTVRVWEVKTGKGLFELKGHSLAVSSVSFKPDRKQLVSVASEKHQMLLLPRVEITPSHDRWEMITWDIMTGKKVVDYNGKGKPPRCVRYSPDGKYIASVNETSTITIWDPAKGEETRTIEGHRGQFGTIAFSRDGNWLASGGLAPVYKLSLDG